MHLRDGGVMGQCAARVSLQNDVGLGMHSLARPQRFETVEEQFLHWRLHLDTETHRSLAATITMTKLSKA